MHSVHLLSLVYVLFSLLSFSSAAPSYKKAAPKPPAPPEESVHPKEGDFVGIRVGKYEEKRASVKKTIMKTPHPAVIVGVPSTSNGGAYQVATISKNHPHNPPRAPIANFINNAGGIYGEIGLTAKTVPQEHLRSWKNPQTGEKQPPLDAENLKKLKKQMEPHKDWVPSRSPTPDSGEGSKDKPAQQAPATHTNPHASGSKSQIHPPSNPHANPHASSSKSQIHPPSNPHANPHASSSKSQIHPPSNPNSGIAGDSKIKHPVVQVSRPGPSFSGSSHGTYVPQSPAKHIGPQAQSHPGGASGSASSSSFSHRPPVNPWRHPQQSPAHVGNVHPSSQSRWPPSTSSHPQRHPQAAPVSQPHHGGRTPLPPHANQKPQHDPAHHRPSQPGGHRPKSPQPWRRPPSRSGSPRPKVSSSSRPPSPHRVWGSRPKVPGHPEPPRKGPSNNHHPAKEKRNVGFRR